MKPGVFSIKQKNGAIVYRSSVTIKGKHISLGTYSTEEEAHRAYVCAVSLKDSTISPRDHIYSEDLPFDKQIILMNFRDHNVYFSNPIYLGKNLFYYFLSPEEVFTFDRDDLFFYARHRIQKRGGRLFVSDYGMQITLKNRYGIKNYAVLGKDYVHINGDERDFRYDNITILSRHTGVSPIRDRKGILPIRYKTIIHIRGNWVVGVFDNEITAAIAYNKAADILIRNGIHKQYAQNYIEGLPAREYASIYSSLELSDFEQKVLSKRQPKNT